MKNITKQELEKQHELKVGQEFWRFNLHRSGSRVWLFDIERVECTKVNKLSYSVKWDSNNIFNQLIKKEDVCINKGYFVLFKEGWVAHKDRFEGYVKSINEQLEGITKKNKNYNHYKNLKIWFEDLNILFSKNPSLDEYKQFKEKHHKFIKSCYQDVFS